MQQKKRGRGGKGDGKREGRVFIHTAQGTSSSEAEAIENAGIEGQLLYLITPAGGSDAVGFPPEPRDAWRAPVQQQQKKKILFPVYYTSPVPALEPRHRCVESSTNQKGGSRIVLSQNVWPQNWQRNASVINLKRYSHPPKHNNQCISNT